MTHTYCVFIYYYIQSHTEKGCLYIVMDYCDGGNQDALVVLMVWCHDGSYMYVSGADVPLCVLFTGDIYKKINEQGGRLFTEEKVRFQCCPPFAFTLINGTCSYFSYFCLLSTSLTDTGLVCAVVSGTETCSWPEDSSPRHQDSGMNCLACKIHP